jgi:biofilm PGA synthesis N-glycosyltransferase PgaC
MTPDDPRPSSRLPEGTELPSYVLITPARNEAAFIEQTIQSVVGQTVLPVKWTIVSDGSEDGTDEIVSRYAVLHPWIELVRMPARVVRHFGGKVRAFQAGYQIMRGRRFDILGSLDADIAFDSKYFDFLLRKFAQDASLGVAGTPFCEGGTQCDYRFSRKEQVPGACQLFRRECFEAIGGYIPLKEGNIDLTAVVSAHMKGWNTKSFPEKYCLHLRPTGKAGSHYLKYTFRSGFRDYVPGVHPLWHLLRSFYQMKGKPFFLSGFLLLAGYSWALLTKAPQPVSKAFIRFRRKEQMTWLREYY